MKPTYEQLEAENQALKKEVDALLDGHAGDKGTVRAIALQLVAVREKLKRLYNNGRGCEVFPATHVVGEQEATEGFLIVHELLNTPPPTLIAQMEKKMEAAVKMAKVVELLRTMTPANRLTSSEWNRVNEALTLWNTANESNKGERT